MFEWMAFHGPAKAHPLLASQAHSQLMYVITPPPHRYRMDYQSDRARPNRPTKNPPKGEPYCHICI